MEAHKPDKASTSDRWEWQRQLKSNPRSASLYRIGVGVLGFVVVAIGIVLLPFPGPGWLVIFLGLGIWASEFDWAQDLLRWVRARVESWWDWLEKKGWWAKALAGLGTALTVALIFWALFAISGVPSWFPQTIKGWLGHLPGLDES